MANWNFTPTPEKSRNVCPVNKETRQMLQNRYKIIIDSPFENKKAAIADYKELYEKHAKIEI